MNEKSNKQSKSVKIDTKVLGDAGNLITAGIPSDEYNIKLKGAKAKDIYDRMRKSDGKISGNLKILTDIIRSATFHVKPFSNEEKDINMAKATWEMLNNMSIGFDDFIRQTLLMFPFGFMVFERYFSDSNLLKKYGDIKYQINVEPRLPKSIEKWEMSDGKEGIVQRKTDSESVDIPIDRLVVFTHRQEGSNREGISVLRPMYQSWFYKTILYKFQAMQAEFHSKSIPVGSVPANTDVNGADYKKFTELLRKFAINKNGYIVKFEGWDVDILNMKAGQVMDISVPISMHNRDISNAFALQGLDPSSISSGASDESFALFYLSIQSTVSYIADVINKYMIKPFIDVNFNDVAGYPELASGMVGNTSKKAFGQTIRHLFYSGAITYDNGTEEFIRKEINMPPMSEEGRGEGHKPGRPDANEDKGKDDDNGKDEDEDTDKKGDKEENAYGNVNSLIAIAVEDFKKGVDLSNVYSSLFNGCFNIGKNSVFNELGKKSVKTPSYIKEKIKKASDLLCKSDNLFLNNVNRYVYSFVDKGVYFAKNS